MEVFQSMAYIAKYTMVKNDILANIRNGVYLPGQRIPTREELLKKYSVTRTTINQALKELVESGLLATSKRGGTMVTAKRIKLKTAIVSGVIPQLSAGAEINSEYGILWNELLAFDNEYDFSFIQEKELLNDLSALKKYDCAVVLLPCNQLLEQLPAYREKVLLVNRYGENFNFVSTNHRQAVREMTEYNIARCDNDCQIFFISPPDKQFVTDERREGFIDACHSKGLFYRICELTANDHQTMFNAMMKLPFEKHKKIVLTSPMRSHTGAVIRMAAERKLKFNEDLFYSDFDNADSLLTSGVQVVSAIQDYAGIGRAVVCGLQIFGSEPVRIYVPYRLNLY